MDQEVLVCEGVNAVDHVLHPSSELGVVHRGYARVEYPSLPIEMADGKWQETIRTFDRASMVPDSLRAELRLGTS
jgi:hypothetical protein